MDRIQLHEQLLNVMAALGTSYAGNVYYQPPENIRMRYPCIVYEKSRPSIRHANDGKYIRWPSYSLTVIDRDPDGPIPDKLLELHYCSFDRRFISDNLYHDVFTIYC